MTVEGGQPCDPVQLFKPRRDSFSLQTSSSLSYPYPPVKMLFRVLKNVSTSLLKVYVEQV